MDIFGERFIAPPYVQRLFQFKAKICIHFANSLFFACIQCFYLLLENVLNNAGMQRATLTLVLHFYVQGLHNEGVSGYSVLLVRYLYCFRKQFLSYTIDLAMFNFCWFQNNKIFTKLVLVSNDKIQLISQFVSNFQNSNITVSSYIYQAFTVTFKRSQTTTR